MAGVGYPEADLIVAKSTPSHLIISTSSHLKSKYQLIAACYSCFQQNHLATTTRAPTARRNTGATIRIGSHFCQKKHEHEDLQAAASRAFLTRRTHNRSPSDVPKRRTRRSRRRRPVVRKRRLNKPCQTIPRASGPF